MPPIVCAATPDIPHALTIADHTKITKFLKALTNEELRRVGLELGLHWPHLKRMGQDCLNDLVHCWLKKDDLVMETSGTPSWESLAKALEEADFKGLARDIRKVISCQCQV